MLFVILSEGAAFLCSDLHPKSLPGCEHDTFETSRARAALGCTSRDLKNCHPEQGEGPAFSFKGLMLVLCGNLN